ncbi:MAG: magnesium transporter [Thermoplasmatota archaeon]
MREGQDRRFAEVLDLVHAKEWPAVRARIWDWEPAQLQGLIEACGSHDDVLLFRALPRNLQADVFGRLDPGRQERLLHLLTDQETRDVLAELAPDERTAFLEELPGEVTRRLLEMLSPADLQEARQLLGYPPESVGRLMTPDYVALRPEWTLEQALAAIRRRGRDSETISRVYVTDGKGRRLDDLRLRQVILGDPGARVWDLMNRDFPALSAFDDRERAVDEMRRHGVFALPVLDSDGVLLGIVTADDALEVAEKEATEDIQKLGGQEALAAPYLETRFRTMVRKRAGWLALLFVGEMLTASAMGRYQNEIAGAVVLALFIPLIISSGGNSGSQASTLVIRALSLGHLRLRDWWRVVSRELAAGLVLGAVLAGIGVVRIVLWHYLFGSYDAAFALVAATVGLAVVAVVTWGTLTGSTLPFLLRRLGFDPATASAPLVATLVDVSGLVIYFTIAAFVLAGHLL